MNNPIPPFLLLFPLCFTWGLNTPAQQKQVLPFPLPSKTNLQKAKPAAAPRARVGWFGVVGVFFNLPACWFNSLLLSPPKSTRSPRPSPTGSCASTARGRSCASRAPSTPACSCKPSTSASSRPSTWRCRSAPSWQPSWGSPRPRYGPLRGARGWSRPWGCATRGARAHRCSGSDSGLRLPHDAGVQLELCRAVPCHGGGAGAGGPPGLRFGAPLLAPPSGTGTFPALEPGCWPGRARCWAALGRGTG